MSQQCKFCDAYSAKQVSFLQGRSFYINDWTPALIFKFIVVFKCFIFKKRSRFFQSIHREFIFTYKTSQKFVERTVRKQESKLIKYQNKYVPNCIYANAKEDEVSFSGKFETMGWSSCAALNLNILKLSHKLD